MRVELVYVQYNISESQACFDVLFLSFSLSILLSISFLMFYFYPQSINLLKLSPRSKDRANDRVKFDYWSGRNNYCFSVSVVWCHGYRDYKSFSKQWPWRCWPKVVHLDQLRHWQNLMLIEGCWSKSFNLLRNYPLRTYLKISK